MGAKIIAKQLWQSKHKLSLDFNIHEQAIFTRKYDL